MLLVIDVGNTTTVIGLYDGDDAAEANSAAEGLLDHWRIATTAERTADELSVAIRSFLDSRLSKDPWAIQGIAVSSGVPRITSALRDMSTRYFEVDPVVIEPGVRTGIAISTDNPREVGADRIANAVGAWHLYGGPTVVVDFGTATTCDVISSKGEYLGGAIAPGVDISLDALFQRASALRAVELIEPRSVIGRTTVEAIQAGAIFGFAGQVDGLVTRIEEEIGECRVVATGGLGSLIAPYSATIDQIEPWITLHGLRLVHAKNAE
ncbi:MAG: type III pantothenate kinase [Acidimicrobiales bacterium]|nr:type III pantothenate kinase [Acidimicrobiales bacterium]